MGISDGDKLFSEVAKVRYQVLRKTCSTENRAYNNCLNKNKIKITSLFEEEQQIKEGIRDNFESIEYLDCAIECCRFHSCDHMFVFIDNPNHMENLPCFCVKCGLSLNSVVFPNYKKYNGEKYVPSNFYLSKMGLCKDNIGEYMSNYTSLGYLPVSKYYIVKRYNDAVKANPFASDDEIARIIIKTVTGERQLTR